MRKSGKLFLRYLQWFIDLFYPPFRGFMTLQFFRYAAVGGINLVIDWAMYYFIFHFVLHKQMLDLGFVTMSSHVATFVIKLPIMLLFGFLTQKYITFSESEMRTRVQLFRYSLTVMINIAIAYFGLKFLVEFIGIHPIPSYMVVTIFTIGVSFLSQKYFTFKIGSNAES